MAQNLAQLLEGLENAVEGLQEDLSTMGEAEIETSGPLETVEAFTQGDGTEGPRRVRVQQRRVQAKKAKQASPEMSSAYNALKSRVDQLSRDMKSIARAAKSKGVAKVAGSGNRACLTATVLATAAGATVTPAAIVGNADTAYDRVFAASNTPSLISAATVAGNPLFDGNNAMTVDSFPIGPIELAEPVKLNGNAGVVLTHANRGAAAGDAMLGFIPVGHSWGSSNPASF